MLMTIPRMTMMMMIIGSEAMRQYTRQSGPTIETLTRQDVLQHVFEIIFLPFLSVFSPPVLHHFFCLPMFNFWCNFRPNISNHSFWFHHLEFLSPLGGIVIPHLKLCSLGANLKLCSLGANLKTYDPRSYARQCPWCPWEGMFLSSLYSLQNTKLKQIEMKNW